VVDCTEIAALATGLAALATACVAGLPWMARKTSAAARRDPERCGCQSEGGGSHSKVGGGDRGVSLAGPAESRGGNPSAPCRPSPGAARNAGRVSPVRRTRSSRHRHAGWVLLL
jgi:hypothetical protein